MPKLTQRDIAESVAGLRDTARQLRQSASFSEGGFIASVSVSLLLNNAAYLEQVAGELLVLIPDTPVKSPKV